MKNTTKERRAFLVAAGTLIAAGAAARATGQTTAKSGIESNAQACMAFTQDRQTAVTPDTALAMLKQGNARFVSGKPANCDLLAQVKATADAQAPFAAVLGCVDSRVPPELVFDQHIGDIFAVRIAGNFVDTGIIGSFEFATKLAGAKLIVVLGHSECGAVKGAIDNVQIGNLTAMLANIRPAVIKIKNIEGSQDSKNKTLVQAVADQHARDGGDMLISRSQVLRELVGEGKLKIVSAMHDVHTGKISWLS